MFFFFVGFFWTILNNIKKYFFRLDTHKKYSFICAKLSDSKNIRQQDKRVTKKIYPVSYGT